MTYPKIQMRHDDDDESWMKDARCRALGKDVDTFFPERGEYGDKIKMICSPCPVRERCLEYALNNGIRHGHWGGVSERARRGMRPKRKSRGNRRDNNHARAVLDALER